MKDKRRAELKRRRKLERQEVIPNRSMVDMSTSIKLSDEDIKAFKKAGINIRVDCFED